MAVVGNPVLGTSSRTWVGVAQMCRNAVAALTAAGRAVVLTMVLSLIAGAVLDWPELLVISGGCSVALVISVVSMSGGAQFDVRRTLHPSRISVGQEAVGVLTIRNLGRRRLRTVRAVDQVGHSGVAMDIPPLGANAQISMPFTVHGATRGVIPVGPLWIGRADPFGLLRRRHAEGEITEVVVHPRTVSAGVTGSGWTKDMDGFTTEDSPLGSVAFHSLRDYQPGDDRRHIHWRSSARAGRPIVRQFVDTRRSTNLVVLDPRPERYESESLAEVAVEIAASVSVAMLGAGQPTLCDFGDGRYALERATMVLDRLAHLELGPCDDLPTRIARVLDRQRSATTVLIITGARTSSSELSTAVAAVLAPTRVVFVTVSEGGSGVVENRANRATMKVSSLEQFQRSWSTHGSARRA